MDNTPLDLVELRYNSSNKLKNKIKITKAKYNPDLETLFRLWTQIFEPNPITILLSPSLFPFSLLDSFVSSCPFTNSIQLIQTDNEKQSETLIEASFVRVFFFLFKFHFFLFSTRNPFA